MITKKHFGFTDHDQVITEFTVTNIHGLIMKVINFGCTITSLRVPDRNGILEDIVLGFDTLDGYLQSDAYLGCVVGRYANRIARGQFSLSGKEYNLAINLRPNHLHGGIKNFSKVLWSAAEVVNEKGAGIRFSHMSPDGDEGYPGNLRVEVTYFLSNDNTLSFEYRAVTDKPTIINLTQHSYFNLNGGKEKILDHELTIYADQFLPVDEWMIPTGVMQNVDNTPFDFRTPKTIGRDISARDDQLITGHGYDHTFVLRPAEDGLRQAATLSDPASGRRMDVYTTEPGMQMYTANFLNSTVPGKQNVPLTERMGVCLETQHFPDSPNHTAFPSVTLVPGETCFSKTLLTFRIT